LINTPDPEPWTLNSKPGIAASPLPGLHHPAHLAQHLAHSLDVLYPGAGSPVAVTTFQASVGIEGWALRIEDRRFRVWGV